MQPRNPYDPYAWQRPAQQPQQPQASPQYDPRAELYYGRSQPSYNRYPEYYEPQQFEQPLQYPASQPSRPVHPAAYATEYGFHGQPYYGYYSQVPARKGKRVGRVLAVVVLFLALLGVSGGGVYAMVQNAKPTPDKVFQKSLETSMSTSSFSEENTSDSGGKVSYKFDVRDVSKPKMSVTADIKSLYMSLQGYDDSTASFVRVKSSLLDMDTDWTQIREEGKLPQSYDDMTGPFRAMFDVVTDGHVAVSGDVLMGNFMPNDRQALISTINSSHVYSYDPAKVVKETIDGQETFKYEVTVNRAALKKLNQQAAKMTGTSEEFLSELLTGDGDSYTATMHVRISDGRLVKVVAKDGDGAAETVLYSGFDSTDIGSAPVAKAKWDDQESQLFNDDDSALPAEEQTTGQMII